MIKRRPIPGWVDDNAGMLAVLALSLLIKSVLAGTGQEINPDGVLYIASAKQYAVGNWREGLHLYPMPAFSLLIAGVHLIIPGWMAAARSITIASMTLATIPLYKLTERLFDRRAAFWAVLFLAVAPEANEKALWVIRDPTFFVLALTSVLFVVKGQQTQRWQWIAAGFLFAGSALLFRVEAVVILTVPPVFLIVRAFAARDVKTRSWAVKGTAVWMAIPLVAGVVTVIVFGAHFITQNRIDELIKEMRALFELKAFDNYRQIYAFLKQIEGQPPFSGLHYSLPETARHWMPLFYLIGLLESLAKQLYPLLLVPLFLGLRKRFNPTMQWTADKLFVLTVFTGYMLLLLYFLVTRDHMVGRLLFTPAILLYPWVGRGFSNGIDALRKFKTARAWQALLVLVFLALPCAKSLEGAVQSDRSAMHVGDIIRHADDLNCTTTLFSDPVHCFYATCLDNFSETINTGVLISELIAEGRSAAIEELARNRDADALVLSINREKNQKVPVFKAYHEFMRIPERKGVTVIYRMDRKTRGNHRVKDDGYGIMPGSGNSNRESQIH